MEQVSFAALRRAATDRANCWVRPSNTTESSAPSGELGVQPGLQSLLYLSVSPAATPWLFIGPRAQTVTCHAPLRSGSGSLRDQINDTLHGYLPKERRPPS